jgi:WD40 repeat protein
MLTIHGPIWCSAFSKDGKYLATGGRDGVVQIWELKPKDADGDADADAATGNGNGGWMGSSRNDVQAGAEAEERDDNDGGDAGMAAAGNSGSMSAAVGTGTGSANPNPNRSSSHTHAHTNNHCDAMGTDIIVINPTPMQRFENHEKDVVDRSWSNTDFLISVSLDKTARLWRLASIEAYMSEYLQAS